MVAPEAGVILVHHTKKLSKQQLRDDPFLALSGASALRGFYTSGMILFRPDEEQTARELHVELRNGPGLEPMRLDKVGGRWVELDRNGERLVRKDIGRKLDAERVRKRDVILQLLYDEALAGRLYTAAQFAEAFENKAGLGGVDYHPRPRQRACHQGLGEVRPRRHTLGPALYPFEIRLSLC